jgi:prefoldin subunit 5
MQKIKAKILTALLLTTIALAIFPLANASTGAILVNTATAPSPAISVPAGGNISLNFGGVTWSGGQFYLMISSDGFSQNTGTQYTPVFTTSQLQSVTLTQFGNNPIYPGAWTIGDNWVNGTIPMNLAGGSYYLKAFDGATTFLAVTDKSFNVTAAFAVTPISGPAGTPLTLMGSAFSANSLVNLTYVNPLTLATVSIANNTPANALGQFNYSLLAPDLLQALAAGAQVIGSSTIIFNARANVSGTITDFPTAIGFTEFVRGLAQVKRQAPPTASEQVPAAGSLFGNLTDFTTGGALPITGLGVNKVLRIAGNFFYASGDLSIVWDYTTSLATTTTNGTGWFNTTITIPITPNGLHNVTIRDSNNVAYVIFVTVVPSLTLNPTSGPVGTSVIATGYGFPAPTTTNSVNATISWPGVTNYVGSAMVDSTGTFTATFTVPSAVGGANTVTALQNSTGTFASTATATFTVTALFTVTPNSFSNNGTLTIVAAGTGFNPNFNYIPNIDNVMLGINGFNSIYQSNLAPNASGYISISFINAGFAPGIHVFTLYANGTTAPDSGIVVPAASALFTVTAAGDPTIDAITAVATTLQGLNATILSINGNVATLSTNIGTVTTSVNALSASITGISNGVASIQSTLGQVYTNVNNLNSQITSIQGNVATISTSVGTLTTSLASINAILTSVQGDIATIQTDVGTFTTSLASINPTLTAIQGSIATIQTDIGTLQGTVNSINNGVASITTSVGTIQTSVGNIQPEVTAAKDNSANVSMLLYVAIVLALIAAIAAVFCIIIVRQKIAS